MIENYCDFLLQPIEEGDIVAFAHVYGRSAALSLRKVVEVDGSGKVKVVGLDEGSRSGWTFHKRLIVVTKEQLEYIDNYPE